MSIEMERAADAILQAAHEASLGELSDVDMDADGSSSLSEIQDQDGDQEEDVDVSDELSILSDEENDSEAETERLEESPNKFRPPKDVVLSSVNGNLTYQPSPSKLHNEIVADDLEDDDDDDPLTETVSINESPGSPKSSPTEAPEPPLATAATSLEVSTGEGTQSSLAIDSDTKKRKRQVIADEEEEAPFEPLRKRTGSVKPAEEEIVVEDGILQVEAGLPKLAVKENIPRDGDGVSPALGIPRLDPPEPVATDDLPLEAQEISISPKRRGRKKKAVTGNGAVNHVEEQEVLADAEPVLNGVHDNTIGEEDHADNEGDDEAEAALKNEEELERKRVALDQLGDIERQFSSFRERLYDDRLEQLNREEAMLRQEIPTHPEYLAMMQCIDAKRDERVRVADNLRNYEFRNLRNYAVARRSQILSQFQQEVRSIRENKLEGLGKQWYEIQHDRRSYAGSVPDYSLKFPVRKSQQILNQVAYSTEVSILSGVAKYVGFPAAPAMAPATAAELDEDLERMGRTRQQQIQPAPMPLQELAALRSVGSASRFKPAEEQFIEQTPWANPQHPSHAHLLQRQASAQQVTRTTSPFSHVQAPQRRHSHQQTSGLPISGTFSSSTTSQPNGGPATGGRVSPHNPFTTSNLSHAVAPSPLGSRQASLSPERPRPAVGHEDQHNLNGQQEIAKGGQQHSPSINLVDGSRDFAHEIRREQVASIMSRF